jgi:hypothetical protein
VEGFEGLDLKHLQTPVKLKANKEHLKTPFPEATSPLL